MRSSRSPADPNPAGTPLPQQAGDLVERAIDVGVDGAALLDAAAEEQVEAHVASHAAAQPEVGDESDHTDLRRVHLGGLLEHADLAGRATTPDGDRVGAGESSGSAGSLARMDRGVLMGVEAAGGTPHTVRRVERWARELIDLSQRNHALYHRPTRRSSLDILGPDQFTLHRLLAGQKPLSFFIPPSDDEGGWSLEDQLAQAAPSQLVTDRTDGQDLVRTLTQLMRSANQDWLDRAVRTLYVSFGQLVWSDSPDKEAVVRSPLVYFPVVLRRGGARQPFLLERAEDEAVMNPSLVMKLEDSFGLDLSDLAEQVPELSTMDEVIEQVEELVDDRGWHVEHAAALKRATFHKESMHRDLQENIATIADHPLVRALAADPDMVLSRSTSELPSEEQLDAFDPPESAHLVLDADASQRRAVVAAKQGLSFVMDGPPGTGKSQTIVNMIAELIAAGRSVLFVSEKAAALDVVAKRLADVGLSDFVLELHSHKANRREVVQELARCVQLRPRVEGAMAESGLRRLKDGRTELSRYAEAVNEVRHPLGRSVSWITGRVLALHEAPELPPPAADLEGLYPTTLAEILEDAKVLATSWDRIHAPDFRWSDADNRDRPNGDQARKVIRAVMEPLEELRGTLASSANSIGVLRPDDWGDAERLIERVDHLAARPDGATAQQLSATPEEFRSLRKATTKASELAEALRLTDRELDRAFPAGWRSSAVATTELVQHAMEIAAEVLPSLSARELTLKTMRSVQSKSSQLSKDCGRLMIDVEELARTCGFSPEPMELERAQRIANVAGRSGARHRPPYEWLEADGARTARQAIDEIAGEQRATSQAMQKVGGLVHEGYLEQSLDVDIDAALRTVIETRGRPSALGSRARRARRVLASGITKQLRELTQADVDLISAAWKARRSLAEAEARHRSILSRFADGKAIDVEAAGHALALAVDVREAAGTGMQTRIATTIFCEGQPADTGIGERGRAAERAARSVGSDLRALGEAGLALATERGLPELAQALLDRSEQVGMLGHLLQPLVGSRKDTTSVADLSHDVELVRDAVSKEQVLLEALDALELDAGLVAAEGASADDRLKRISEAATWAGEVRVSFDGPLAPPHAEALIALNVPAEDLTKLRSSLSVVREALQALERFIGREMARRLRPRLGLSLSATAELLSDLSEAADQLPEWWEHQEAKRPFIANGIEGLLEDAALYGVPSQSVPNAIERALLTGWLMQVLRSDPRLKHLNASKRDSRVAEFQRLDRELLHDAARRAVEACAGRLPQGNLGAVGLILKEAHKKARHLPVRTLLERVGPELTRLKPCLMMSPLSVSQYIPPDWRFDAVIFDEASQIPPQDAVNCIYRGDQLVIAGDDRQLPPTSFFEIAGKDDEDDVELDDFESVLGLAKGSAALADLGLRWHYRSRHEDLITFSNQRFYDGELVTYPGAIAVSPTLGVAHHLVPDGIYHRGARKDNPREAQRVAEIVAQHVRQSPHLSIGVVALSSAQAEAIEDAVDRLRRADHDLDEAFRSDRLDGFFVKNLENVQGDDRDIIVLSIGYGPDSAGKLTMNFGPMNQSGGWRRLNVAVTRARNRMDVVSSFTADRLRPSDPTSSLAALQAYLAYAERSARRTLPPVGASGSTAESPLEDEVLRRIRSWGYEAVPQVGSGGYRIDIGVLDPDDRTRFLIGIECDAASYHSSKVARDRDRLRQQVLQGLGWRLHRVWSPAWFRNPDVAEDLLRQALDTARRVGHLHAEGSPPTAPSRTGIRVVRQERSVDGRPEWAVPYTAHSPAGASLAPLTKPAGRLKLRALLLDAVRTEAPVHVSRLREIANEALASPLTGPSEDIFLETIDRLRSDGIYHYDDGFIREEHSRVRVRSPEGDGLRRSIDQIAPEEVDLAVAHLLRDALAATRADLERGVRDLFGFRRLGRRISEAVGEAIDRLELEGTVLRDPSGKLTVAPD